MARFGCKADSVYKIVIISADIVRPEGSGK